MRAFDAVTGWGMDGAALLQTGKRIVTLKRLLNLRRGLTREDDRLPKLLLQPLADGGTEGLEDALCEAANRIRETVAGSDEQGFVELMEKGRQYMALRS